MHRNWKDLIKPSAIDSEKLSTTYGKFVIAPLEKGYAVTIGNSLRRVMLSSINGASVVAVRFAEISHEFSIRFYDFDDFWAQQKNGLQATQLVSKLDAQSGVSFFPRKRTLPKISATKRARFRIQIQKALVQI